MKFIEQCPMAAGAAPLGGISFSCHTKDELLLLLIKEKNNCCGEDN